MDTNRLTTAANEMYDLIVGHRPPRQQDLAQAADIACRILEDLVNDRGFREDVEKLARLQQGDWRRYRSVTDDLAFRHVILEEEKRLLLDHGFDQGLVDTLVRTASDQRQAISEHEIAFTALRSQLEQVRNMTCNATMDPQGTVALESTTPVALYAVSGAAIMALTASSPSIVLPPAGLAVLGAIGSALVSVLRSLAPTILGLTGEEEAPYPDSGVFGTPPAAHLVLQDPDANVMTLDLYAANDLGARGLFITSDLASSSIPGNMELIVAQDVLEDIETAQTAPALTSPLEGVEELREVVQYRDHPALMLSIAPRDPERNVRTGFITNQASGRSVAYTLKQTSPASPNLKPVTLPTIVWTISCNAEDEEIFDTELKCQDDAEEECEARGYDRLNAAYDCHIDWRDRRRDCVVECTPRCE